MLVLVPGNQRLAQDRVWGLDKPHHNKGAGSIEVENLEEVKMTFRNVLCYLWDMLRTALGLFGHGFMLEECALR